MTLVIECKYSDIYTTPRTVLPDPLLLAVHPLNTSSTLPKKDAIIKVDFRIVRVESRRVTARKLWWINIRRPMSPPYWAGSTPTIFQIDVLMFAEMTAA